MSNPDPNSWIQAALTDLGHTLASKNHDYKIDGEFSNFEQRRERYATPLFTIMRENGWDGERTEQVVREMDLVLDAIIAVADAEIQELANKIREILSEEYPDVFADIKYQES